MSEVDKSLRICGNLCARKRKVSRVHLGLEACIDLLLRDVVPEALAEELDQVAGSELALDVRRKVLPRFHLVEEIGLGGASFLERQILREFLRAGLLRNEEAVRKLVATALDQLEPRRMFAALNRVGLGQHA